MANSAKASSNSKSLIITICVILCAVLVIGLTVYTNLENNGTVLRMKTAAESENFKISGAQYAYFFGTQYQSYYTYLSYFGVDTSKSLKSQDCSMVEGSWYDYFVATTENYISELLALCEGAKAAGISLDKSDNETIDAQLEELETAAKQAGYSVNTYLAAMFGAGVNKSDVKKCMELSALASKYYAQFNDGLTYTDEQIETYYNENQSTFDGVDIYRENIYASAFAEKDEEGNPVADSAESSKAAKEYAETLAAASSENDFISGIKAYEKDYNGADDDTASAAAENAFGRHVLASSIASVSDWAFSAKAGDTYVYGEDGATTYTVYYLVKSAYRDETKTRAVRHILFSNDNYEDSSKADEVYAEWESAGFTEEKLIELANTYTDDTGTKENGGLYENISIGDTVAGFDDWVFDSSRKSGDHGIVETTYGWHIVYYVGEGDSASWMESVISTLKSNDYQAMIDANSASVKYNESVEYSLER